MYYVFYFSFFQKNKLTLYCYYLHQYVISNCTCTSYLKYCFTRTKLWHFKCAKRTIKLKKGGCSLFSLKNKRMILHCWYIFSWKCVSSIAHQDACFPHTTANKYCIRHKENTYASIFNVLFERVLWRHWE